MSSRKRAGIAHALQQKSLIKFSRAFEPGTIDGYVLDIGPKFFLMAIFGDGFSFDGFSCVRISDVKGLKFASDAIVSMYQKVLKARGRTIPDKPSIDLTNIETLLRSANDAFPLVAIHHEKISPGACNIGRVAKIGKSNFWLREIDTDASWDDDELFRYKLADVTLVDFGGDYETGLHQAGGPPP
ncbi:MAG TPA: hypothetical protein VHZ52_04105 [Acidobacteriaceae bacterium]|jgi:hypothetical protein|nr:hypothetical protein [Acidobacteriaceae bacterium]